jgi:hypothetical protein
MTDKEKAEGLVDKARKRVSRNVRVLSSLEPELEAIVVLEREAQSNK